MAPRERARATVTALGATVLLLVAACALQLDGPESGQHWTVRIPPPSEWVHSATTAAQLPQPTIETFGAGGQGRYLWVTSIVRNVQPGQFVVVSFNLFNAAGSIVATASQTEQGVNPNARIIIGTQVRVPEGDPVISVQPWIDAHHYDAPDPQYRDVILSMGPVSITTNIFDQPAVQALLTNNSGQQIPGARVGVACFDAQGSIIGGGVSFPEAIPAWGQIMVNSDVMVSQEPAHCEMTAQPSER